MPCRAHTLAPLLALLLAAACDGGGGTGGAGGGSGGNEGGSGGSEGGSGGSVGGSGGSTGGSGGSGGSLGGSGGSGGSMGGSGGDMGGMGGMGGMPIDPTIFTTMKSGSRLKVLIHDAGGGAQVFAALRDADLDVDCTVENATDGSQRCVPVGPPAKFSDPGCTMALIEDSTQSCGGGPEYLRAERAKPNTCGAAVEVYKVGDIITPPASTYALQGDQCVDLGPSFAPNLRGATPVAPADLVAISRQNDPRGPELLASYCTSMDGAQLFCSMLDVVRAGACASRTLEGVDVCGPSGALTVKEVPGSVKYSDLTCTVPAASLFDPSVACPTPGLTLYESPVAGGCGELEPTVRETGFEVAQPYSLAGGSCNAATADYGTRYFEMGAPVPATDLPAVSAVTLGSGSVVAPAYEAAGAPVSLPTQLVAANGEACNLTTFTDDLTRCLPKVVSASSGLYSNSTCTAPLASVGGTQGDPCVTVPMYAIGQEAACPYRVNNVYQVGAYHTGAFYASDFNGGCVQIGCTQCTTNADCTVAGHTCKPVGALGNVCASAAGECTGALSGYYKLGATVPASTFPTVAFRQVLP